MTGWSGPNWVTLIRRMADRHGITVNIGNWLSWRLIRRTRTGWTVETGSWKRDGEKLVISEVETARGPLWRLMLAKLVNSRSAESVKALD